MGKTAQIRKGAWLIVDKIQAVKRAEDAINTIIDLFERSTHWRVKNKPIRLDVDDNYSAMHRD